MKIWRKQRGRVVKEDEDGLGTEGGRREFGKARLPADMQRMKIARDTKKAALA